MKRTSSPYEELGSDELPFLYHNDKELPPVDLLLEKDGRTLVKARKSYHQTTDSPELVKETPDFGGARRHIKRKTRKNRNEKKRKPALLTRTCPPGRPWQVRTCPKSEFWSNFARFGSKTWFLM